LARRLRPRGRSGRRRDPAAAGRGRGADRLPPRRGRFRGGRARLAARGDAAGETGRPDAARSRLPTARAAGGAGRRALHLAEAAPALRPGGRLSADRRTARLAAWRAGLARRAERLVAAWGLRPGAILADRPAAWLLDVTLPDGRDAVLKLAPPGQAV